MRRRAACPLNAAISGAVRLWNAHRGLNLAHAAAINPPPSNLVFETQLMSEPLAGKIAFVTGGARGIGRAIVLKLATAGCDVAIAYHNSHEEAEGVVNAAGKLGRRAFAAQTDVSDPASVAEAFAEFRKHFER